MNECQHTNTTSGKATRSLLDKTFSTGATVCADCGSVLWNDQVQGHFNKWLERLYTKEPDRFVLQPRLSQDAIAALDDLVKDFPGSSRGLFMRAISYVVVEDLPSLEGFAADMQTVETLPSFKELSNGDGKNIRVRVNPRQYLDFETWGKVIDVPPSKVMERAVMTYLTLLTEYRKRHADEQTRLIRDRVVQLLKAA